MKSQKIALLCILAGALLASTIGQVGCLSVPKDPYGLVDPFESDPADGATNNNDFPRATKVALTNESATFSSLLTTHDVDVYSLGSVAAGDRLVVDIDIPDRVLLNAAVGVFDSVGRVFYLNEEVTQTATTPLTDAKFPAFAPHFEFTVAQATSPLYLAVASLPESTGTGGAAGYTAGPYTVSLTIQRGGPAPQPVKQVVALQFDDSLIDYPPMEVFGQWLDNPPAAFTGLSGRVLDPGWWRPFIIMQTVLEANQNNLQFWTQFLTFAGTAAPGIPNLANLTPQQMYVLVSNELIAAIQAVTTNPNSFVPGNPPNIPWFANNGFVLLDTFSLYLGPGIVGTAGLNIWNGVLAAGYPATQNLAFADFINVTQMIKSQLDKMYAGLNIEFLVVGVDTIPTNVPVESLYVVANASGAGARRDLIDPNTVVLTGLSSDIDIGNQNRSDFAAIFAGELGYITALALGQGASNYPSTPDDSTSVLGFVCGHELGHTLGLIHTSSQTDVMKRTGGSLADLAATFSNAPIDSSMFPIGTQDSGLLLLLELGMQ